MSLGFFSKTFKFSAVLTGIGAFVCTAPKSPATPMSHNTNLIPVHSQENASRYVTLEIDIKGTKSPDFYFTDLPYDKDKGLLLMKDDGLITDYTVVLKLLNGGIINGKRYPGITYTDGTGKKVNYKYSFAINANDRHDSELNNVTSWTHINEIIAKGHAIMNHSLMHGGTDKLKSVKDAEKNMWKHTHYRMTEFVVPSNDEGFVATSLQLGYNLISSEFGEPVPDGNNDPGKRNIIWGSCIPVSTHNFKNILITRTNLGDQWNKAELIASKQFVDRVFIRSNKEKKLIGAAFSHGPGARPENVNGFFEFLMYIKNHPSNNDSAWITSSKELMDYMKTKNSVVVASETFNTRNRKYKIILDMDKVDPSVTSRNLSLKIVGGTIANIVVEGANAVTFNASTGLINIYKQDFSKVIDPNTDILPPQIASIEAINNIIKVSYDKPVEQSKIYGYEIAGNKIIALKGSGKIWQLIMEHNVTAEQTFSYRMQSGDAAQSGQKELRVCSYIGASINLKYLKSVLN